MVGHEGRHGAAPRHAASRAHAARGRADAALALACAGLLGLTLLSTYAVSGTFAKYVTSGTGADSARVARFGTVSVTGGNTIAVTGSSAMGTVTAMQALDGSAAGGIALFVADGAGAAGTGSAAAEPVKVQMTRTEVAAKVLLTVTGTNWQHGTDATTGADVLYCGGYSAASASVWFEVADGWTYLPDESGTNKFVFSRTVEAGGKLDAPVMRHDRLYSNLTVEKRAALGASETAAGDLTFTAQAIQID